MQDFEGYIQSLLPEIFKIHSFKSEMYRTRHTLLELYLGLLNSGSFIIILIHFVRIESVSVPDLYEAVHFEMTSVCLIQHSPWSPAAA